MIEYVLGFMFDDNGDYVALIEKNRPKWQAGRFNGVGGKIEQGETPHQAMVREFSEETGVSHEDWRQFMILEFDGGRVHIFSAFDGNALVSVDSKTDEQVFTVSADLGSLAEEQKLIPNLLWIIPLAKDREAKVTRVSCSDAMPDWFYAGVEDLAA